MTTQWGAPLTGAQMRALRAAGLPDDVPTSHAGLLKTSGYWAFANASPAYRLPADHIAYTLLEKGWLDQPNVRLWNGGDKAPDDYDSTKEVLFADGSTSGGGGDFVWRHCMGGGNIIAYIAKVEASYPADGGLKDQVREPSECQSAFQMMADTLTLNKMTEAEWSQRFGLGDHDVAVKFVLDKLGLIKPEPTLEERFWAKFPMPFTEVELSNRLKGWVTLALEFERV